jgi:hypothetical protein
MPGKGMTMRRLTIHPSAEKRPVGRPKKILDLRKLDGIKVATPKSAVDAIVTLLIADARCLDVETRRELLRIMPQMVHIHHAWKAEYMECGCISCHRKKPWYGAGGFCNTCWGRIYQRMKKRFRKAVKGRDLSEEVAIFTEALTLKSSAAQRLLAGEG